MSRQGNKIILFYRVFGLKVAKKAVRQSVLAHRKNASEVPDYRGVQRRVSGLVGSIFGGKEACSAQPHTASSSETFIGNRNALPGMWKVSLEEPEAHSVDREPHAHVLTQKPQQPFEQKMAWTA